MLIDQYEGLALAYHDVEQFDKGIYYAKRALDMAFHRNMIQSGHFQYAMNALAINYDDRGDHDSAIMQYQTIIDTLTKYNPESIGSNIYNNIGNS